MEDTEIKNNGHNPIEAEVEKVLEGAKAKLDDLRKEDGAIAKQVSNMGGANVGVLTRLITAVNDENYRELLGRAFSDPVMGRKAVAAITECKRFGLPITPIVDRIAAESSVNVGNLLQRILESLTHTTFTTNYQGEAAKKQRWWDKGNNKDNQGIAGQ